MSNSNSTTNSKSTSSSSIDTKKIQKNLDEMIPYINEILDSLPETEKIFFAIDEKKYPEGTFVLQKNDKKYPIVPQVLLSRLRSNIDTAFNETVGSEDWGWEIKNPETDVDIDDLQKDFEQHKKNCYNQYNDQGKDLQYKLDFRYKVLATILSAPEETASSKDKFYFTVRALEN